MNWNGWATADVDNASRQRTVGGWEWVLRCWCKKRTDSAGDRRTCVDGCAEMLLGRMVCVEGVVGVVPCIDPRAKGQRRRGIGHVGTLVPP